jgi:hypothetical protein
MKYVFQIVDSGDSCEVRYQYALDGQNNRVEFYNIPVSIILNEQNILIKGVEHKRYCQVNGEAHNAQAHCVWSMTTIKEIRAGDRLIVKDSHLFGWNEMVLYKDAKWAKGCWEKLKEANNK